MSALAGKRVLWRLAWRGARAQPRRHVLIVALLALAVAASVGAAIGLRNVADPDALRYAARFGSAELIVERVPSGASYAELPAELQDEVDALYGGPLTPVSAAEADARVRDLAGEDVMVTRVDHAYLPADATDELRQLSAMPVFAADPTDPVLAGRFVGDTDVVPGDGEILISYGAAAFAEVGVGDRIELPGLGTREVVGIASDPLTRSRPLAIAAPDTELPGEVRNTWYIDGIGPQGAEQFASAIEPDPTVHQPSPRVTQLYTSTRHGLGFGTAVSPTVVGSLVATVLLVQVGFIAAAAFATGSRRRIREFGLLAATSGADPRHVSGLVRREALVLGTAGATIGAIGGVAVMWLALPLLERMADRTLGSLAIAAPDVLLPAVLAVVAGFVAAWLPARTAGNVPLVGALAGRVPLRPVARWVAPAATLVAVVGATVFGLSQWLSRGGLVGGAVARFATGVGLHEPGMVRNLGLICGVTLLLFGVAGLSGPLVQSAARLAHRLPVPARLALRDSARQRTRSAATVAALMVVLTVPVVVFTQSATEHAGWNRQPATRDDVAVVTGPSYGDVQLSVTDDMLAQARAVLPPTTAQIDVHNLGEPDFDWLRILPVTEDGASSHWGIGSARMARATPQLRDILGVGEVDDDTVILQDWYQGSEPLPDRFSARLSHEDRSIDVLVDVVVAPHPISANFPELLLPDPVAERLELQPTTTHALVQLASAPSHDQRAALASADRGAPFDISISTPFEPPYDHALMVLAAGALAILVALAIAGATAALAATESDHDLDTMAAIGADPRLRPRFRAIQAGYHVLLAAILAVPAGLLLSALQRANNWPPQITIPALTIAAFVVASPALVALAFRWLSRATPTRLTVRRPA